jgi:hypothetical protein
LVERSRAISVKDDLETGEVASIGISAPRDDDEMARV